MAKENYTNPSYKRSDHPSFQDKKHTLLIDSQSASNREIKTESGTLKFEDGVAVLPNDERAKDIYDEIQATEARHPNQYSLVENKPTVNVDKLHRYTFGWNRSFGDAWDSIFGKSKDDLEEETNDEKSAESRKTGSESIRGASKLYTNA